MRNNSDIRVIFQEAVRLVKPPASALHIGQSGRADSLEELGFSAAQLNFEGVILQPELVAAFRKRLGKRLAAGVTMAAACE